MSNEKSQSTYTIEQTAPDKITVGFAAPGTNDVIVKDAAKRIQQLINADYLSGGPLLKINGPASLPVAMVLAHAVAHLYETVACYDPKLQRYVVVISHSSRYNVGDLIFDA